MARNCCSVFEIIRVYAYIRYINRVYAYTLDACFACKCKHRTQFISVLEFLKVYGLLMTISSLGCALYSYMSAVINVFRDLSFLHALVGRSIYRC